MPWIEAGRPPTSPKAIAEKCREVGIPAPPVKARDGEEAYEEWETALLRSLTGSRPSAGGGRSAKSSTASKTWRPESARTTSSGTTCSILARPQAGRQVAGTTSST